jgi:prevent-host-death family protein
MAILAINRPQRIFGWIMQTLSAKDAKYNFGRLIDMARAEPVTVEKHGRAVVVVLAVEEYERLVGPLRESGNPDDAKKRDE